MIDIEFIPYTVLTTAGIDFPLTYLGQEGLCVGQLVEIPFRNKRIVGVITRSEGADTYEGELKEIQSILPYRIDPHFLTFIENAAQYTMIPVGLMLKMCITLKLDAIFKQDIIPSLPTYVFKEITLNADQHLAFEAITQDITHFNVYMLDGVTGAGKTEVYFASIQAILNAGKKALVLFPEIALTQAIVERFTTTFGTPPFIWHSAITPAQKRKIWKTIQQPGAAVILGARSALFLPIQNLGLIVVDEEHDASYKQDEQGAYNARDMAIWRAKQESFPIILASATPSLETYANVKNGRYRHLKLKVRYGMAEMPMVHIIDRKEYLNTIITKPICDAIHERLSVGEQSLLFLNRRGFSPLLTCFGCGHHWQCPGCHVDLTVHRNRQIILCHFCGFETKRPTECPTCNGTVIKDVGLGIEKVEEEARQLFPDARILLVSSDTLTHPETSRAMFQSIEDGQVDIIIGTQVLAKGHHFPNLTCVGILDADRGLYQLDLRAAEKAFQLLSQVGGRAGRMAKQKGIVMVQTREPEHPLYKALQRYDRDAFYEAELFEREMLSMPPFARLISITLSSLHENRVAEVCRQLARVIPLTDTIDVLGPSPSPLYRLRSRYRMHFLIRGNRQQNLQAFTKAWLSCLKIPADVTVHIDVDPLNFL